MSHTKKIVSTLISKVGMYVEAMSICNHKRNNIIYWSRMIWIPMVTTIGSSLGSRIGRQVIGAFSLPISSRRPSSTNRACSSLSSPWRSTTIATPAGLKAVTTLLFKVVTSQGTVMQYPGLIMRGNPITHFISSMTFSTRTTMCTLPWASLTPTRD